MTPAKLIEDLRARFPTFTVEQEGDLIRVEIPDARTVWIALVRFNDEVRIATTREGTVEKSIFDRRGVGPCYIPSAVDYLLWCIAHDIDDTNANQSPDDLRRFIGGPFDAVVRDLARTFASGIKRGIDRHRAQIAADLDAAKARADREGAAADLEMKRAWAYLEILEPAP
jgi:hypothetical protein